jgi:hypothetical protein
MARSRAARLTFAVISDSHKISDAGKVDAFGIFDTVNVWALPATRVYSFTVGIKDLPAGTTEVEVYRRVSGVARTLGRAQLASRTWSWASAFAAEVSATYCGCR